MEQFAQRASETGEQSFAIRYGDILRIVAKMLASPVPLLSNVDFVREEAEHTRISLPTRVLNIAKLGSKGSQAEAHGICKGKKESARRRSLKPGQNQKKTAGRERYGQGTLPS